MFYNDYGEELSPNLLTFVFVFRNNIYVIPAYRFQETLSRPPWAKLVKTTKSIAPRQWSTHLFSSSKSCKSSKLTQSRSIDRPWSSIHSRNWPKGRESYKFGESGYFFSTLNYSLHSRVCSCSLSRFALSFGLDALKNREAVTQLHREGILFSVNPMENPNDPTGPPPNIAFLEIVTEFTNKLLKQDKKVVLQYLDKRISSAMPSR